MGVEFAALDVVELGYDQIFCFDFYYILVVSDASLRVSFFD